MFLKLNCFPFFPTLPRKKQILQTDRPPVSWPYGVLSHHCCSGCFHNLRQTSGKKKILHSHRETPPGPGCTAGQLGQLWLPPRACASPGGC